MLRRTLFLLVALHTFAAFADSAPLNATTSWIGNTYPGGKRWVQQDIRAMSVMPDGTVFTNVEWDEGGGQVGEYRNGELIRYARHTHGWGNNGGNAVAANSKYLFIAHVVANEGGSLKDLESWPTKGFTWFGISRRQRQDIAQGAPFTGGKGGKGDTLKSSFLPLLEVPDKTKGQLAGLAANDEVLIASDPLNSKIHVLNAETMQELQAWAVDSPGPIAFGANNALWILQRTTPATLSRYSLDGKRLPQRITFPEAVKPTGFCADQAGRLLVADSGAGQQILIYENADTAPVLKSSFGQRGGVYAGTPGEFSPLKFNAPQAVGVDSSGNIYVASDGQTGGGGTVLESYTDKGKLNWQLFGLSFVDLADFDPADDSEVFTKEERFRMNFQNPTGKEWSYAAYTVNPFKYPQDPRLHIWSAGAWVRQIGGKRILFVNDMNSDRLQVYRFDRQNDGEIAIPSGLFAKRHIKPDEKTGEIWPPNQPDRGEWIWRDENGNGAFDAGEFQTRDTDVPSSQGTWVDSEGNIWLATETNGIRLLKCAGLDGKGNPTWNFDAMTVFPHLPEFQQIKRVRYYPESDVLYVGGTTAEDKNQHWKPMGPVVARYDGWLHGKRERKWTLVAPYVTGSKGHESCEPMGFDVAGDYLFIPYTGASKERGVKTGRVEVFKTADGSAVGHFEPSEDVGEIGLQDIRETLRAHRRKDGEYVVFLEDDYKSKTVMYRWKP